MSASEARRARRGSQRRLARFARAKGITLDAALDQVDAMSDEEKARWASSREGRKPSSRHYRKPHVSHCKEIHSR